MPLTRAAAEQALRPARALGGDDAEVLQRAGASVGLRVRILALSPTEILAPQSRELLPAIGFAQEGPLAVVGRTRRGRGKVSSPGADAPRALDAAALAQALGASSPDEPLRWVIADPQSSLDTLGGHDGGHPTPRQRLLHLLRLERDDAWVAVIYAMGVGLLSIATPLGVQFLVNTVAFGALLQPLVVLTLLVTAGLVFAGTLRGLQAYVVERLQQRVFARIALDFAHRLPRVKASALDGKHGPELLNRFFDVVTLQKGAATLLVDGISVVLMTLVGMALLAVYHPLLLAFDAFLIAAILVIVFVLGRGATPTAIKESKAKYALAAWLQETMRHRHAFQMQRGDVFARARAEALTADYVSARRKHFRIVFRQFAGALVLQAIASAVLLGVGGWLVIERQLTLGQLVAAELIVTAVVAGFSKLGKYFESYYDLLAGIDKLGHIVDLECEHHEGLDLAASSSGLELRAHGLAVSAAGREVLADIDLEIRAGSAVALLGPSGAGKSALLDILAGLRMPARGRLDVDGVDSRELAPGSLRSVVAMLRYVDLFEGTVAENIQLGRADVTRHEVRRALERVGAWEEIAAMPDGIDTKVGTSGAGLHNGLAWKLVLARALAGAPRLLVVDGAFDGLDHASRGALLAALGARGAGCTLVVASARPGVLDRADQTLVVEGGRVARPEVTS